jgi:uncharacterized protein YjbJ (UPF0337 family)
LATRQHAELVHLPVATVDFARTENVTDSGSQSRRFKQPIKERIMAITPNKDQVKGELKDLGGKIQEEAGKLFGSKKQQAKGLQKQAEGKLQKGVGDLKEAVTDTVKKA